MEIEIETDYVDGSKRGKAVAYVYIVHHPPDNCLDILDASGGFVATRPSETCDALAVNVLPPGGSQLYSSWDLKKCVARDCLAREVVAPGLYHFSATFYLYSEDGSFDSESSFTFEEPFTRRPASN